MTAVSLKLAYQEERKAYLAKRKELREEYKKALKPHYNAMLEKAKAYFKEEAKILFECHPFLEKFSWVQYTPYFNDGDECIFSVHYDDAKVNGKNTWVKKYDYTNKVWKTNTEPLAVAKKDVVDFLKSFKGHYELFGDHAHIIVTRDKVVVKKYHHDEG